MLCAPQACQRHRVLRLSFFQFHFKLAKVERMWAGQNAALVQGYFHHRASLLNKSCGALHIGLIKCAQVGQDFIGL